MTIRDYRDIHPHLATTIQEDGREVMMFIPGGSFLSQIPNMISAFDNEGINPAILNFTVGDERYDQDPNHSGSNFRKLTSIPEFKEYVGRGARTEQILGDELDIIQAGEKLAEIYDCECNDDERLTIGIFGVGVDGHTAGIFPHDPKHSALFYGESAVGYSMQSIGAAHGEYDLRITTTFDGFHKLDLILIYALGEPKRNSLQRMVSYADTPSSKDLAAMPALFFSKMNNATLFTDLTLAE